MKRFSERLCLSSYPHASSLKVIHLVSIEANIGSPRMVMLDLNLQSYLLI
jgi:hypothetical protein